MLQNFKSSHELLERISKLPAINPENIQNINTMADSITTAAKSLSDENTIAGLKHLESISKKIIVMIKKERDSKFIIYQVLYIFVITVLAIKGADLNLREVVSKEHAVMKASGIHW